MQEKPCFLPAFALGLTPLVISLSVLLTSTLHSVKTLAKAHPANVPSKSCSSPWLNLISHQSLCPHTQVNLVIAHHCSIQKGYVWSSTRASWVSSCLMQYLLLQMFLDHVVCCYYCPCLPLMPRSPALSLFSVHLPATQLRCHGLLFPCFSCQLTSLPPFPFTVMSIF